MRISGYIWCMSGKQAEAGVHLTVENIGGIDETTVTFEPGITVLSGRNATNRTSLLQAIMAAHGSDNVSVKADADEGHVELSINGETYSQSLSPGNGNVRTSGNPYLDDPTLADLFAFLLESNESRQAVVTGENLREIIMRPIDTEEINAEVDRLVKERRRIDDQLAELDDLKDRLPALKEEQTQLNTRIEEKQTDLETVEAEIEVADADVEQRREKQADLEATLEELQEKRSALDDVRYELETEQESLESLRADLRQVEEEYDRLPATPANDMDELETRIDRLRSQKQDLEAGLNELQSVIEFNQERLNDDIPKALDMLKNDGTESDTVTDELLADDTVTCWTCGTEVAADQIERAVAQLQEFSRQRVAEIGDIEEELDELTAERDDRRDDQRRREQLERRQQELETEIETTEAQIGSLTERRKTLHDDIEAIEAKVEALENDAYKEILELHKEANQLEYDIGSLETDLERVEENITRIEGRLDKETELESRRGDISDEIEDLRTKIERIERQAVDEFNDRMATVLDLLEYDNLARIWLERKTREVREGRRKVTESILELHVTRETESGATYADTVGNLSESEREVTGLVFALAGYVAHEVHETVPFILLDSLEAIDPARIARIVEYLSEMSEYLVVALLEEDAGALTEQYQYITEI